MNLPKHSWDIVLLHIVEVLLDDMAVQRNIQSFSTFPLSKLARIATRDQLLCIFFLSTVTKISRSLRRRLTRATVGLTGSQSGTSPHVDG
jgi:hypothetical protein